MRLVFPSPQQVFKFDECSFSPCCFAVHRELPELEPGNQMPNLNDISTEQWSWPLWFLKQCPKQPSQLITVSFPRRNEQRHSHPEWFNPAQSVCALMRREICCVHCWFAQKSFRKWGFISVWNWQTATEIVKPALFLQSQGFSFPIHWHKAVSPPWVNSSCLIVSYLPWNVQAHSYFYLFFWFHWNGSTFPDFYGGFLNINSCSPYKKRNSSYEFLC